MVRSVGATQGHRRRQQAKPAVRDSARQTADDRPPDPRHPHTGRGALDMQKAPSLIGALAGSLSAPATCCVGAAAARLPRNRRGGLDQTARQGKRGGPDVTSTNIVCRPTRLRRGVNLRHDAGRATVPLLHVASVDTRPDHLHASNLSAKTRAGSGCSPVSANSTASAASRDRHTISRAFNSAS